MYDQRFYFDPVTNTVFLVVLYLDNGFRIENGPLGLISMIEDSTFDFIDDLLDSIGCVLVGHL